MEKKKIRRVNNIEEARKKLGVEEIEEKRPTEESKVQDFKDIVRELTGVVRENHIMGFQLRLSIWEENLRILSSLIEQWVSVQEGYTTLMKNLFRKLPSEAVNFWGDNSKFVSTSIIEDMLTIQKDYSYGVIN